VIIASRHRVRPKTGKKTEQPEDYWQQRTRSVRYSRCFARIALLHPLWLVIGLDIEHLRPQSHSAVARRCLPHFVAFRTSWLKYLFNRLLSGDYDASKCYYVGVCLHVVWEKRC
jgi:hypothetical protein